MRCHMPIHSIEEFDALGTDLNYPLQLDAPGKLSMYPNNSAEVINVLRMWFENGPIPVTVIDHEEEDST
jgi:hypothetical protein